MNKVVTFGDFVREHTAAVCTLAGLIILILGLLLYRMYVNGTLLFCQTKIAFDFFPPVLYNRQKNVYARKESWLQQI